MLVRCEHCGSEIERDVGHVNRSRALGMRLFCDRKCAGLARRTDTRTKAEKIADKAAYDRAYRAKNLAEIKRKRHEHFKRTYDPAKAAAERKKTMPRHVEYCRRPEYRKWKQGYDRQYRSKKLYGDFAEAAMLATDLNRAIKERSVPREVVEFAENATDRLLE